MRWQISAGTQLIIIVAAFEFATKPPNAPQDTRSDNVVSLHSEDDTE